MSWFRVDRYDRTATLHIGDEIGFGEGDVSDLLNQLEDVTEISLVINSSGGCTKTANRIYNSISGRTPLATVTGTCASSAVRIALAASHIRIVPDGRVMVHSPRAWTFASAAEMRSNARHLDSLTAALTDAISKRVGEPSAVLSWLTDGEDHWFNADDAWHAGLVDEIIQPAAEIHRTGKVTIPESDRGEVAPICEPDNHAEELFFKLLAAHGPVTTANPKVFLRNALQWLQTNVRQK